ncbi:hypothetical protein B0H19DRAFT_1096915 [Mycena capillaripes]|nr:hypothetical protein B0H19DRAFT_1096915 [Mycena capillaripes]
MASSRSPPIPPKDEASAIRRASAVRIPRSLPNPESPVAAIEEGFTKAFTAFELPSTQSKIDKLEDRLTEPVDKANEAYEKLNTFYTANAATISTAAGALASAVNLDVHSIEATITSFAESSAVLMKGLDALGNLHPFVGGLCLRKHLVSLVTFRPQSLSLILSIARLRHMRDPDEKGPDGTTLKDRMSGLMQSIAKDITACGSACDVYMKKSFLAKTIKSKIYESRLAGYVSMFANHKKEIGFALKVHTALGVDAANKKLDGQGEHLKLIEDKMEALFRKLDTPREREVQRFIDDKGGAKACVDNEATLAELVLKSGENLAELDPTHSGNGDLASAKKLLNKELAEDVDEAFKKNMKLFDRKLEMQSRQLADAINTTGEHIISVLSGGAHDKILDPDLQAIWKDQGWKGSVKARHFVLALNDYYSEKFSHIDAVVAQSAANSVAGSVPASPLISPSSPAFARIEAPPGAKMEDDRWALSYINVTRLQSILEAVDDDGTGFVSIKEANDFAMSRPEGWSLLSWVAFWAAGWHASVTWYKNRIYNLLDAMMSLLRRIKPANVQAADTYFAGTAIQRVELLLRSTRSAPSKVYSDPRLKRITDAFQDLEEEKLLSVLDGMVYEIDDVTTLRMITGSRRIERYVFPLIYHLLKRHFDIMRMACVHVLDVDEFDVMSGSLAIVFKAVDERTNNLEAIFKATSTNITDRLGQVAFGMFENQLGFTDRLRDPINNTSHTFTEEDGFAYPGEDLGPDSDDDDETKKVIFARMDVDWLRFDPANEPVDVYDFEKLHPPPKTLTDPLDGTWTGQILEPEDEKLLADDGTISLVLKRNGDKLEGGAENFVDIMEFEGTVAEDRKVVFTITWGDDSGVICTGQYDPETDTIAGTWEEKEDEDDDDDDDSSSSSDSSSSEESDSDEDDEESSSESGSGSGSGSGSEDGEDKEEGAEGEDEVVEEGAVASAGAEKDSDWVDEDVAPAADDKDGDDSETLPQTFIFRRTPAEAHRFRYTDAQFKANRARARWGFAIAAAIDQVQRAHLSWPYLKKRFAERRRFIELLKRDTITDQKLTPWTPLSDDEEIEFLQLKNDLPSCDARFYYLVSEFELQKIVSYDRDCASCDRHIQDVWLFCVQCMDDRYCDTIDLCCECIDQTAERDNCVHDNSHIMVKTIRRIHDGEMAWLVPEALVVAERAKKSFQHAASLLSRVESGKRIGHSKKSKSSKATKICCCCEQPVSPLEEVYICIDCDAKRAVPKPDSDLAPIHDLSHPLVYILDSEPIPEPLTTDVRLAELETKMSGLDSKMAALEEKLESRFASLETILHGIGDKLAVKD